MRNLSEIITLSKLQQSEISGLPDYIDPRKTEDKRLTPEKLGYLVFLGRVAKSLAFPKDKGVAVLGVGQGYESRLLSQVLNRRELAIPLYSVDYNLVIIKNLIEVSQDVRIAAGQRVADIRKLSQALTDNSCSLIVTSSILHEVESEFGWEGVKAALSEQDLVLSPGGFIIIRDFCPPPPIEKENMQVRFKTGNAKKFFSLFVENFSPPNKPNWEDEWNWINGRQMSINISSRFFFEVYQHFRWWYKDYWQDTGSGAFSETFFTGPKSWPQLKEGYIMGTKKHAMPSQIVSALKNAASVRGSRYLDKTYFLLDNMDDGLILDNFEYKLKNRRGSEDPISTKRMLVILYKIPEGMGIEEANKNMAMIDKIFEQVDKKKQLTWKITGI